MRYDLRFPSPCDLKLPLRRSLRPLSPHHTSGVQLHRGSGPRTFRILRSEVGQVHPKGPMCGQMAPGSRVGPLNLNNSDHRVAEGLVRNGFRLGAPAHRVPTSPFIRTQQRQSRRKRGQFQPGVRVSRARCIRLPRARLQTGSLPRERRRKVVRNMAGRNRSR